MSGCKSDFQEQKCRSAALVPLENPRKHSLVRDGQTSPHTPRLVVSRSTCPPREQLCNRSCSNKTHTRKPWLCTFSMADPSKVACAGSASVSWSPCKLCECLVRGNGIIHRAQKVIQGDDCRPRRRSRLRSPPLAPIRNSSSDGVSDVARVSDRGRVAEV